jgi:hypothetical protein
MMSHRLAVLLVFALATPACLRSTSFDHCEHDTDCASGGASGRCEPGGVCSIADDTCASGHRFHDSAPGVSGQCVDPGAPDGGLPDTAPAAAEHECVEGLAHTATAGSCAAKVCAKDATCCTTGWSGACVWWAESVCGSACATMAFVGGDNPDTSNPAAKSAVVIDPIDLTVLWSVDEAEAGTHAAAWADYDGDGDADLATAGDDLMRIFRNDGITDGKLALIEVKTASWHDLNPGTSFDGRDVRWVQLAPGGPLSVLFLGYGGMAQIDTTATGFSVARALTLGDSMHPAMWEVSVGDANGDGYPELATAHWGTPPRIYQNDHGTLVKSAWTGAAASSSAIGITWCNLDGDATPELVIATLGGMTIYDVDAATNLPKATPSRTFAVDNLRSVRCADLNNDGLLDLFVSTWYGASPQAYRGDGSLGGIQREWPPTGAVLGLRTEGAWSTDLGDVDHDGKLDVLVSGNGYVQSTPTTKMSLIYYRNTSPTGGTLSFEEHAVDGSALLQITRNVKLAPRP